MVNPPVVKCASLIRRWSNPPVVKSPVVKSAVQIHGQIRRSNAPIDHIHGQIAAGPIRRWSNPSVVKSPPVKSPTVKSPPVKSAQVIFGFQERDSRGREGGARLPRAVAPVGPAAERRTSAGPARAGARAGFSGRSMARPAADGAAAAARPRACARAAAVEWRRGVGSAAGVSSARTVCFCV